jgi:hypothetical protein
MAELDLSRIYAHRFDRIPSKVKIRIWSEIAHYILEDAFKLRNNKKPITILDPACGDGEFLNGCVDKASSLYGCDLRARPNHLHPSIDFYQGFFQDSPIKTNYDLIWVSNLLEHLPDPETVQDFLLHCKSSLSKNGILTIMGPNIKYCANQYWDFADHLLPLSHLTLLEHLASAGLKTIACTPRFLPYSFRSKLPTHPILTKIYLQTKLAWPVLGKQFLIRATKP